jgi:hypothetical protein
MDDDVIIRIPGRLRPALVAIQREEFRRTPADAVRAIVEREIFNRSIRRRPDGAQKSESDR